MIINDPDKINHRKKKKKTLMYTLKDTIKKSSKKCIHNKTFFQNSELSLDHLVVVADDCCCCLSLVNKL